jgi:hypothetical protein
MSAKIRKCDSCGKRNFQPAPMLRDEVWLKLADEHETLCDKCMWQRQRERHVSITIDSLKPCPVNVARGWFNLFAQLVNAPPKNIAEWRAIAFGPWVLFRTELHPWLDPDGAAPEARDRFSQWLDEQEAARVLRERAVPS